MKKIFCFLFILSIVFTSNNASAQDSLETDTLIAYYSFSGSAEDSSGFGNHGEVFGATLTRDRFGNENSAYTFNGIDDYVSLPSDFDFPERSVSLWFNVDEVNGYQRIYYSDHPEIAHSSTNIDVFKDNHTGELKLRLEAGGGQAEDILATIYPDTWYHAVIRVDSLYTVAFLNGELIDSVQFVNHHASFGNANAFIGTNNNISNYFFNGFIDDVRIYNYTISDSAITNLYSDKGWPETEYQEPPLPDTLVAYYSFSGTAEDSSGFGNHGEVVGAALTRDRFGNENSAYKLDGVDDYVEISHSEVFNSLEKTISFWFKKEDFSISENVTGNNSEGLLFKSFDTGANREFGFEISRTSPPFNLLYSAGSDVENKIKMTRNDMSILPGNWYQVTGVIDSTHLILYLNGQKVDSVSHAGSTYRNSAPIVLGKVTPSSIQEKYFNGVLDDLKFYNYALSDSAILESYYERGWPETKYVIPDTLVAYYPFSGNAVDSSGFGNHGEVVGATLTLDRFGNENSAYKFNGYSDFINTNTSFDYTERTTSFWFKADREAVQSQETQLIINQDSHNLTNGALSVSLTGTSLQLSEGFGESRYIYNEIEANHWYHVVLVREDSVAHYYLNNQLLTSTSSGKEGSSATPNETLLIGVARTKSNRFFNGEIDDLRIYNYALSNSVISDLYTEKGWPLPRDTIPVPGNTLAAYYQLDGNVADSSGFENHGEIFGASLTEDRFERPGMAYSFDGIDDYIKIENPKKLHSEKNLSFSFWAKGVSPDSAFRSVIATENNNPFNFAIDDGDRILFSVQTKEIPLNLTIEDLSTNAETWYHYSAVYRANEYLRVYRDGIEIGSLFGTIPKGINYSDKNVFFGATISETKTGEDTLYFNGSLDEVRFYNHDLSDEQIDSVFAKESKRPVDSERSIAIPSEFHLYQNYPNPFNPSTVISFDLPENSFASVKVYDLTGRLVSTLIDENMSAGHYQLTFDAANLASGIYIYELRTNSFSSVRKFTLIK